MKTNEGFTPFQMDKFEKMEESIHDFLAVTRNETYQISTLRRALFRAIDDFNMETL